MNIILTSELVDIDSLNLNVTKHNTVYTYSTFHPIKSPHFATRSRLMRWFREELSVDQKVRFVQSNFLAIYINTIAAVEMDVHGYQAKKGEILSTDESDVYDFTKGKWL